MNSTETTSIYATEYLGNRENCLFVRLTYQVGIVVSRNGDYLGTAADQNSAIDKLHPGDNYIDSMGLEIRKAVKDFLEKEKSQMKIYVTEYLGNNENFLFIQVRGLGNFVVSRSGEFRGLATSSSSAMLPFYTDAVARSIERKDVKKAIKDFLENKKFQENKKLTDRIESLETEVLNLTKLLAEREASVKVVEYTGDECTNCVYVPVQGSLGRVVNLVTRTHVGYAKSFDKKILNSKPWEVVPDDTLKAIDEYLINKPGELQQGRVTVRRAIGSKTHLVVKVCKHNFVVSCETREVVAWNGSDPSNLGKSVDKDYFDRFDKAVEFHAAVYSYLSGLRGVHKKEKTIGTILEPFKHKYLEYLEKKKTKEGTPNMYFAVIGKISSCLLTEDLQLIIDAYPAFSHGESIRMALVNLYGVN